MSDIGDCLEHIIGLSQTTCACWEDGKPADYNTSDSNIYLTDLEPLSTVDGLINCENGSVWEILEDARDEAIKVFIADANGLLLQNYKLKRQPYVGKIGETRNRNVTSVTNTYCGMMLYCADVISGSLTINAIGTLFQQNGTVDVTVVDNLGNTWGTYTCVTQANRYVNNPITPLVLDLHSDEVDHIIYYFYYTHDVNNRPLRNQLSCMCGGFKPIFNVRKPYFNDSSVEPRNNWARYVMAGGFSIDDLTNLTDPDYAVYGGNELNGLTLDVSLQCKTQEVFCKDTLNYDSNPLANAMALAIRFKAVHIVINKFLTSDMLNRDILINREAWIELSKKHDSDYQNYLGYVVSNVYIKTNDCFECKNVINAIKTGIFA